MCVLGELEESCGALGVEGKGTLVSLHGKGLCRESEAIVGLSVPLSPSPVHSTCQIHSV